MTALRRKHDACRAVARLHLYGLQGVDAVLTRGFPREVLCCLYRVDDRRAASEEAVIEPPVEVQPNEF